MKTANAPKECEPLQTRGSANPIAEIKKCHGSFCRYLRIHNRSLVTGEITPDSTVGPDHDALFPSRLPWHAPPGKFKHRRGLGKTVVDEAFTWMHTVWVLFNFLHAGSPSSTQGAVASVAHAFKGNWTAKHEKYARTVFNKLLRYCAHPRGTMERGTSKLSELIERIQISQYDPDINLDEALCGAKDVDPSRVSLPEEGAILDPRDHLTSSQLRDFVEMPRSIPRANPNAQDCVACHKVDDKDVPELLRKLHRANMITFLPKSQVLSEGRKLIKGGLFCVPHKADSDRLINDRRPLNLREDRLDWCQLPCGPMLTQLILSKAQSIRASGDDLSNYFYLIKHLEEWQHRNAFGKPFRGSLLPEMGLNKDSWYLPAFKVLCMGDRNGVDLAQATHESLLRNVGCLDDKQTLVYGKVFPCSKTLEGLYIDDHLVFQITDKKPQRDRGEEGDEKLMHLSRERYEELKLPRSTKKAFDKQYNFKAWGTQVDSQTGLVSAPTSKLRQIEMLTFALLKGEFVTKKAMQKLVGLYVHPFMHRRECMSIFNHVYKFIERVPEGHSVKLPQHIKDELITSVLLLPLASSSVRWPVSTQVSATDASSVAGGRAATLTTGAFSKTLFRFGEKRGEYTRLDWDTHAIEPPSDMIKTPQSLVDTLMKHQWVETESCSFAKKKHINLLELEMLRKEIVDRVNTDRGGCRIVNLCDSRVVVGAFAKGRSSSVQMNHKLRACVPWLLAGDVSVTNLWVDTHHNPADYPSRYRAIPKVEPLDPEHPDPLLESESILAAQIHRSPCIQKFLEQEAQRLEIEPLNTEISEVRKEGINTSQIMANLSSTKTKDDVNLQASTGGSLSVPAAPCRDRHVPLRQKMFFREIFAGKAELSRAMGRVAFVEVMPPVDNKHGRGPGFGDMLDKEFFNKLLAQTKEPNQVWHFGLPCSSFSILQHSNKGTRRKNIPAGDGTLSREVLGNELLRRTLVLIASLEKHGNHWTLENPATSYVWLMPGMLKCSGYHNYTEVCFDQCAYGLKLKDTSGKYGPCRKRTKVVGNLPRLTSLEKTCACHIPHVHAVGGIKTKTGWRRRSELAGHYPKSLCQAYSELVSCIL